MSANNTQAREVCDCFEALFADKHIIPYDLELQWLKMAVAQYSTKLEPLDYNVETSAFESVLPQQTINVLAQMINVYYQERETSRVNKRVSIVTKDISIDGNNGSKTAARAELEYKKAMLDYMVNDEKPASYS